MGIVENWLAELSHNTKLGYRKGIDRFQKFCNCSLEGISKEWNSVRTYEQDHLFERKWKRNIKAFKASLSLNEELATSTRQAYLIPILSFFRYIDKPLNVKLHRNTVTYHNRDITREEIDSIVANTFHIREKAFFTMIAQTGLRPVVLSRLQYFDIKEDWENRAVPCRINVPKKKNKGEYKQHFTFMPQESVNYLRKYFDSRFGIGNNPNNEDLLFSQDDKENIPLNIGSETNIFSRIVLKLGITEITHKGKPKEIRMYSLRKWFRNRSSEHEKVDSTFTHFWMGHKLYMQDEHYFTNNIETHRDKFKKASEYLKISDMPDTDKEKVRYLEAKLLTTVIESKEMKEELQELREEVDKLSSDEYFHKRLDKYIAEFNKTFKEENPDAH